MFCDICIGVLRHRRHVINVVESGDPDYSVDRGPTFQYGHHTTGESFATSASHGCPICQTAWDKLSNLQQASLHAADSKETKTSTAGTSSLAFITIAELSRWVLPNTFSLNISYYNKKPSPDMSTLNTFILEPDENCTSSRSTNVQSEFTSDRTSSTESMQKAAQWLQECVSSHLTCNKLQRNCTWYPTRLLSLANSCGDDSHVRLIHTAQEPPVGPFSTLSHCWGNVMPSQLTQAMASESNPRFLVGDLPKTFREAIQVSKILGIWYLWIDSLCIIQSGDDRQDWYREAGLIEKVYMHSHCNLSATDAEDGTKGLFRYRTPQRVGRPRVKVNLEGMQPNTEHTDCLMTDFILWPNALGSSPLDKRGWFFQERYLAPRVLHFCRNQLFWECREHTVCETFPHGLPLVSLRFDVAFLKSKKKNEQRIVKQLKAKDMNEKNWEDLWFKLVWMYTRKNLSVSGDKLVALSGVAKYVMPHIRDVYVAGMWRRNLERTIMWCQSRPRSRLPEYRAPSWSWASVDGLVYFYSGFEHQTLIHVEDVVLHYATEDSTGAVTGGWLDLRGSLKPMRLQGIKHEWDTTWYMIVGSSIISEDHADTTCEEISVFLDAPYSDVSAFDNDNTEGRLFFMPGSTQAMPHGNYSFRCLLFRLVEPDENTFERIGITKYINSDPGGKMLLAELDEETKVRLPCLHYKNGLHTIRVI